MSKKRFLEILHSPSKGFGLKFISEEKGPHGDQRVFVLILIIAIGSLLLFVGGDVPLFLECVVGLIE